MSRIVVPNEPPLTPFYMNKFSKRCVERVKFEFSRLMHLQSMSHDSVNYSPMASNNNCFSFMTTNCLSQCTHDSSMKLPHSFTAWKHNLIRVRPRWNPKLGYIEVIRHSVQVGTRVVFSPTSINSNRHRTKSWCQNLCGLDCSWKIAGHQNSCRNIVARNQAIA